MQFPGCTLLLQSSQPQGVHEFPKSAYSAELEDKTLALGTPQNLQAKEEKTAEHSPSAKKTISQSVMVVNKFAKRIANSVLSRLRSSICILWKGHRISTMNQSTKTQAEAQKSQWLLDSWPVTF